MKEIRCLESRVSKYYVRFRGHVAGPFSTADVLAQWRSGRISGLHEFSADGTSWTPLSRMQVVADASGEEKILDPASAAALRAASAATARAAASAAQSEPPSPPDVVQHAAASEGGHSIASTATSRRTVASRIGRWMYCSECGAELLERAIVCPSCGCPTRNHKQNAGAGGEVSSGGIAALYIVGFFIPLFGWIGAIYLLVKGHIGNGIGVGALSTFAFLLWIAAFG
jgi:hypothetical protein